MMKPSPAFRPFLAAVAALSVTSALLGASEKFQVTSYRRPLVAPDGAADRVPGQIVIGFVEHANERDVSRVTREAGGERGRRSAFGNRYLVTLDEGFTVEEALSRLKGRPEVEYAEPNFILRATQARTFRPNDTGFASQWHMRQVGAERTWAIQKGDPSVVVAVLDTGIAYEDFGPYRKAPDFNASTFVPGFDFINNDAHANDDEFHGTHVAGTIAQATNNGLGVAGLAFECRLMPVKVLDALGSGPSFTIAEGIDFAARSANVKVINMSLGGRGTSTVVANAVARAVSAGITVVAASGNDGEGTLSFPANITDVIAVGALDGRKIRAPYSNFGSQLSLMAPGGNFDRDDTGAGDRPDGFPDGVLQQSLHPDFVARGRYDVFAFFFAEGTSQATPHVSAAAALLYQQGITDPRAIRAALEQTAEDLGPPGRDNQYGHGLIRPALALSGLGLNK